MSNDEIFYLFKENKIAIYRGWFSQLYALGKDPDGKDLEYNITDTYTITTFPGERGHSSTYIPYHLAILNNTLYKNTSKRVIQYLCSAEFQRNYAVEYFNVPAISSLRQNISKYDNSINIKINSNSNTNKTNIYNNYFIINLFYYLYSI